MCVDPGVERHFLLKDFARLLRTTTRGSAAACANLAEKSSIRAPSIVNLAPIGITHGLRGASVPFPNWACNADEWLTGVKNVLAERRTQQIRLAWTSSAFESRQNLVRLAAGGSDARVCAM